MLPTARIQNKCKFRLTLMNKLIEVIFYLVGPKILLSAEKRTRESIVPRLIYWERNPLMVVLICTICRHTVTFLTDFGQFVPSVTKHVNEVGPIVL